MHITKLEGSSGQRWGLKVDGDMTIYHAQELKDELLAYADASAGLDLDLSGVEELDSVGIQILLLLKKAADGEKKNLLISACSAAVREVLGLYRLEELFGIGQEAQQAA